MGRKPPRPRPGQKTPPEDARQHPPSPVHTKVRISFERYDPGGDYCLSRCDSEQIQSFLACLRKLTERTWQQLLEGSSKGASKSGLNSTTYARADLRNSDIWPAWLGPDVRIIGVRATERRRIFGARIDNVFYIIWFDERHQIVEG
jgi:hypothetical protein